MQAFEIVKVILAYGVLYCFELLVITGLVYLLRLAILAVAGKFDD